nr:reverse transcriptase domain-containing protein [Tanacetum cinerariifolium]
MMMVTTTFLRKEVTASNQVRKKTLPAWKQQEAGRKHNFERSRDFRNQQRSERRRDKFTLFTKSPKEILALDKGKFKTSPPMTTPVEKNNKFREYHGEVGHNTDECMHLRRQIKELIKNGKLTHDPSRSKKLNGSSYRTPHWFQRRNHMANGKNIVAGKNRGCGAFKLYMDEFYGGEITISVQWDHRKAMGEEDSSSPVNSSLNVKIPSSRKNTHSMEQQDNPTRVHNGL